jgi:hypothetical protein
VSDEIKSTTSYDTGSSIQPPENIHLQETGSTEKDFRDYFLFQSVIRAAAKNVVSANTANPLTKNFIQYYI